MARTRGTWNLHLLAAARDHLDAGKDHTLMTTNLAIAVYVCIYLALGFALSVGAMKGKFGYYNDDSFGDTATRGFACLGITLIWPIMGTVLALGRMTK
jgi:Ca2+/H+ antiporter